MFKRHIIGISVTAVLLVLAYVAYAFISKDDIILMVQKQIEKNFHQKVTFSNVSISVLPSLTAEIDDLALYQDEQNKMVEVKKIVLNLNIDTLMQKELVIESIEITSPAINIDPNATASEKDTSADSNRSFDPKNLKFLKKVTLRDGSVNYGSRYHIGKISADIVLSPEIIKIEKLKATVGQNGLSAVVSGLVDIQKETITLNLAAKSSSLKTLLQQFDINTSARSDSLENFKFAGTVKADRKGLLLKNARIILDDTHVDFETVVKDYNASTMAFRTTVDEIDLNRYLPDTNGSHDADGSVASGDVQSSKDLTPLIELVKKLRISNSVKIGSLKIKNYELSDIFIKGKIANGKVRINPVAFKIYDGKFEGSIAVDLKNREPYFDIKYRIKQADIESVFKQRKVPEIITGRVNLLTHITTFGSTIDDLLENADADIALFGDDLMFNKYDIDAALEGFDKATSFDMIDLAGVVAGPLGIVLVNTYDAIEMKKTLDKGGQTKIVKLMASWKVRDLVASARDVAIKTPKNRIAVKGDIDLKNARIKRLYIAILNKRGCAKFLQKIKMLDDGSIDVSDKLNVVTTPFKKLFDRGEQCRVFYRGRVK